MAIAHEWKIANLERTLSDGVVYTIHYTIDAFDGTYRSGAYGSLGLEPPEPDSLIPYADLTAEMVVEWTKEKIGEEKVAEIEAALAAQIQQQIAPTTGAGVPWAS
jgi:hypothetical protein